MPSTVGGCGRQRPSRVPQVIRGRYRPPSCSTEKRGREHRRLHLCTVPRLDSYITPLEKLTFSQLFSHRITSFV